MAFLEWRRFNFFELKKNVDNGKIAEALGDANVAAFTSGNGYIVLCDTNGFIHLISRTWSILSFKGYETTISHAIQIKSNAIERETKPLLVTIGEDEPGLNSLVKVWDTNKSDKNVAPMCVRILRPPVERYYGTRPPQASAICAQSNILAVGMNDGTIWLRRGDLTRERGIRQRTMRDGNAPITGLAIQNTGKQTFLYVSTMENVFLYNISIKDKEYKISLDSIGCAQRCSILAETKEKQDSSSTHFMIARDDAVYCYTPDGRGPCYAVDGDKIMIDWFRSYLVIVARNKSNRQAAIESGNHLVTILDIQNKFLVFSAPLENVKAVLNEWGSFYLISGKNELYHLDEKDLQSKLNFLFKKNLYDVSIRMAKSQQYDKDSLIDIFRQYGDHLYAKGDHAAAVEQYIKTIGKLEASYVIRKFLDSQHIDKLTMYLQALHKLGYATENHTTLLLNCYTKLDHRDKLKEFIMTKDRDLDFDIDIAIHVCRRASAEDALLLAKKHGKHDWYLKIQIEDQKKYVDALNYIANLQFIDAEMYMKKYGKILIENVPVESTEFLKKLCSNYKPADSSIISEKMLDGSTQEIDQCDPDDFIHLFLNNTEKLVEFLEYLVSQSHKYSTLVYNTLIENYVNLWHKGIDKNNIESKVLKLLQNPDANYDKNQALVICQTHGFSPGVLYLYEDAKLYQQILRYQMRAKGGDMQAAIACCRRYGHQEPTLWVQALWYCAKNTNVPTNGTESSIENIIPEILSVIAKERLISPLMVLDCLCSSPKITLGVVRKYLQDVLLNEIELTTKEQEIIEKYREETQKLRDHVKQLRDEPIVFQGSRCAACHRQLELPAIHFMCGHSYHQHCPENESDCPACLPENKQLLDKIKSQQTSRDLHETFHSQLDRAEDTFSLLSEYFGRGVFSKLTLLTDSILTQKINESNTVSNENNYDQEITSYRPQETKLNYGPGAESRLRLNEGQKQAVIAEHQRPNQRNRPAGGIIPTSEGRMRLDEQRRHDLQYSSSLEANLTRNYDSRSISKSSSITSNSESIGKTQKQTVNAANPFEEDTYDDSKNPFRENEESTNPFETDDDYDKNLNPFA